MELKDKCIEYFRGNILESFSSYNGWRTILLSRSSTELGSDLANFYVDIQGKHMHFFVISERSMLVSFVVLTLQAVDRRRDVFSLLKIDSKKTLNFIQENKVILDKLKKVRDEIFAHKSQVEIEREIPSMNDIDKYFENLFKFYNQLSLETDKSVTNFSDGNRIIQDIECAMLNIHRGDAVRKVEVDIKWKSEENPKKLSRMILGKNIR